MEQVVYMLKNVAKDIVLPEKYSTLAEATDAQASAGPGFEIWRSSPAGLVRFEEAVESTPGAVEDLTTTESYESGIGWAVMMMKRGARVRRRGWNGKGMHIELQVPDSLSKMSLPYVYMRTAQGDLVPWLCSQTDLLAQDWELV